MHSFKSQSDSLILGNYVYDADEAAYSGMDFEGRGRGTGGGIALTCTALTHSLKPLTRYDVGHTFSLSTRLGNRGILPT